MANLFDEIDKELAARSGSKSADRIYRPNGKVDWYAMATGAGANGQKEEPNDTIGNGFFGHVVDSAQAGAAGTLGSFARFLEEFAPVGNEWMGEFANDMDKIVKRNTPLQPLEGTDWIAGALGNAIGSGIPSIAAGAAIIGAAGAVGAAVPASLAAGVIRARQVVPALDRIVKATKAMWESPFGKLALTETAGSVFEGASEAGSLIGEMREKGYTDEEIRNAAIASASMNTGWLLVANAIGGAVTAKYGKEAVKGGLKQMAKNVGKGAVLEGTSEGVQEYGQSLIGNVAEGTELDHEAAREAAAQAFVGSGILGGFGGAAAPYINSGSSKAKHATKPVPKQSSKGAETSEDEASLETGDSIAPEVQQARNEIIGHRETLNEDDAEYGRLSEILEKGNDEEILEEAAAIRGKTPQEEVTVATEEVPQPEVQEEADEELAGEVVDTVSLEEPVQPVPKKEETTPAEEENGGDQNDKVDLPPKGETGKAPENTGDNGKPQEDGQIDAGNQQESGQEVSTPKPKTSKHTWKKEIGGLPIVENSSNKDGAVYHNPKTNTGAAISKQKDGNYKVAYIKGSVAKMEVFNSIDEAESYIANGGEKVTKNVATSLSGANVNTGTQAVVKPQKGKGDLPPKAPTVKVNKYGYKETLGDYSTDQDHVGGERSHYYKHKNGKVDKAIFKNDDDTYTVETIIRDNKGESTNRYAGFRSLEEAETYIATKQSPADYKARTWWGLVKKEDGTVAPYRGNADTVQAFKSNLRDKGYEVIFVSTPEKFYEKEEEYRNEEKNKKKTKSKSKGKKAESVKKDDATPDDVHWGEEQLSETLPYKEAAGGAISWSSENKISKELAAQAFDYISNLVQKKYDTKVITDAKAAYDKLSEADKKKYVLKNGKLWQDGSVAAGFYNKASNTIYIDTSFSNADSIIHEYTHLWVRLVQKNNPELWGKGIELLKKTKAWDNVREQYKNLKDDDAIANEVLAQLSGNNFQNSLKNLEKQGLDKNTLDKLVDWYKKLWKTIKDLFASEDQRIANMSLEEFVNMPVAELLKNTRKAKEITLPDVDYSVPLTKKVAEERFQTFFDAADAKAKNKLREEGMKDKIISLSLRNTLKLLHNKNGSTYRYRVSYFENSSEVGENIEAAPHHALEYITGIKSVEYTKKNEIAQSVKSKEDEIRANTGYEGFKDDIDLYIDDDELLNLRGEEVNKEIKRVLEGNGYGQEIREAVIKDLPSLKEDDDISDFWGGYYDKFAEAHNDMDERAMFITEGYYHYLLEKYSGKSTTDSLLVPVSNKADIESLVARLENGESRITIWEETGWYKAKDGRWKYFIDDDLNKIDLSALMDGNALSEGKKTTVGELYDNQELYAKFPYLKTIKVVVDAPSEDKRGEYDHSNNTIKINNNNPDLFDKKLVLIHEIEHAVQEHEKMAIGANPNEVKTFYDNTVETLFNRASNISKDVEFYLEAVINNELADKDPFGEKYTQAEKEASAQTLRDETDALKAANLDETSLKKINTLAEQAKTLIGNLAKAGGNKNEIYLNALGEQEARLVEELARLNYEGLSVKDAAIVRRLKKMIVSMPEDSAKQVLDLIYEAWNDVYGRKNMKSQALVNKIKNVPEFENFFKEFYASKNLKNIIRALAPYDYIMGNDTRSIVFFGGGGKSLSAKVVDTTQPSLLARGVKAVVTKKPKSIQDDINKNGYKGFARQMFRKFYRAWVDKNTDIKDFDEMLEGVLGRALSAGESIYEKIQMISSNAAGLTSVLIEGDGKHIKAANTKLERKKMKYKVSLASVFEEVNNKAMKPYENYLKESGCQNWVEALGAYLGWRRLAEMARLHREAFMQEHAEWKARKRAYDEWANSGRIGKNPLVEQYEAWEAYQKNLKNSKRRWERNGKIGPDPTKAIKAEWLATHKDEEAPKRVVGKEPIFEPYKTPKEAGNLTEEELNQLIKQAPPPFLAAAKKYYMLNDNILSVMEDAGLIDAKTHELLNEKYKDYCPMIRDFSDTAAVDAYVESITSGGNGVANISSMLKKIRAEGSERTIINPLESTIQTIAAVSNRAERNKAGQHLVLMMNRAEDLKGYIKKLEQPKHGTIQADPKNCIFTVMFNGKKVAYQADPNYYQAIVGYNLPTSSLLMRIPQTAAKCLRTGATMSPSFIVRNVLRDTVTAGIASKNGFIPIIDTVRGAMALWNNSEFRAQFEASGVVAFNQYGSAESAYQNLTDMASGKNYSVYEPKKIIAGVLKAVLKGKGIEALKTVGVSLEQLSSFVESATRAGEFKKALESGKTLDEAAYDAKEVTLNFSRSGIIGQRVNQNIPFFNACIQGGDKMIRLFYENPTGTALKVGQYIVLPSLALWLMNHDEEWYEELDPATKYSHWCLPNGVRIPKPQEYGILWGGGIEAVLDQAFTKDPRAMKEWVDAARDALAPSVLPTVILPLIEWVTNYSFFKGRDLVPQRLQRMPDELQYSTGTSELSKFFGKHTYFSPIKIDNLVRGYTGTMGMTLWQTPDWFAAEKQNLPAKEISEMQFIRDFNITDANRNRYVNDFYELQQKANQQQAGYGLKGKPSAAIKAIRKAGKTINDLNKQIRTIETSEKYTPERKRELIDAKRERIRKTAKVVVQKYGQDFL